jgi:predicted transcriptional regulator
VERAAERITDAPITVMSKATKSADRVFTRLTDFADSVLDMVAGAPAPRHITPAEYLASATARQEFMEQVAAERAREAALDRMTEDRQAGRHLAADDVSRLTRNELENIKRYGDDYMKQLIDDHLRTQERKRGGRDRER